MKKPFKILGILLTVIVLLIAGFLTYVSSSPMKTFTVHPPEVKLPTDSTSLAFGKTLVTTMCAYCHLGTDGKLSGRLFNRKEDPFGEMWSANITQHPTKGIGRYSNGELAYLMRTGVNRDGRFVGYMMCHPLMSDEHLAFIIAFLRTDAGILQPSEAQHPIPEYVNSTMVKAFVALGMYTPLPYDGKAISAPPVRDKVAYGRYLATDIYECYGCHSPSFETLNPMKPEKTPGYFGGGNPVADEDFITAISTNLTPDKTYGLGNWTEQEFHAAVKTGNKKDGSILKHQMPRFSQLSDEEVSAIWAYLQTIPALENNPVAMAK